MKKNKFFSTGNSRNLIKVKKYESCIKADKLKSQKHYSFIKANERKELYIFSFLIFSLLPSFVSRQKKANREQESMSKNKFGTAFYAQINSER